MKKLIIPSLILFFSVCKVEAQTTAATHPVKQQKKTVMVQPKKSGKAATTVTVQKTKPVASNTKPAAVHPKAVANQRKLSTTSAHKAYGNRSVSAVKVNRADTTRPKHTYAKAHMKHTRPVKKTTKKTSK